jgi:hypothetical protein
MNNKVETPFTDEQVKALNDYQASGQFHPYTCGNDSRHRVLVATTKGWHCPDCDYTQKWAHGFSCTPARS